MTECLNCSTDFDGDFCPQCGQSASTQRFSLRRLLAPEFIFKIFDLNHGFLRSCLSLLYRPGYMVFDYISGQRKTYFNFVGLMLVLMAIQAVVWSISFNTPASMMVETIEQESVQAGQALNFDPASLESLLINQKLFFVFIIPLAALLPWLLLRKLKYNLAEHMVVVTSLMSLSTLVALLTVDIAGLLPVSSEAYQQIYNLSLLPILLLHILLYWQLLKRANYHWFPAMGLALICVAFVNAVTVVSMLAAFRLIVGVL